MGDGCGALLNVCYVSLLKLVSRYKDVMFHFLNWLVGL